MDINKFYELRDKLYAAAAAGCGLIAEDFRLKRALEAFQPISKANKVFERLYQMCEKLFTSDNVASDLTDCIALADALAVTQGSFMDNSECTETDDNKVQLEPQTMSYKVVQDYKDTLLSATELDYRYTKEDLKKILEPRIFLTFIKSLKRNTAMLEDMAESLLPQLNHGVIELLKAQVDLKETSGKNKTAYYIKLIGRLYGYQENEWYLSLIEKEEYPKSVREAAVHAMEHSEKNIPKLLELYKTQKGNIKKAVMLVLAKMDSKEADEIWKPMAKKYKESYDDIIAVSRSDVWADFIREEFHIFLKNYNEYGQEKHWELRRKVFWFTEVLYRKYQLEDIFSIFAEKYSDIRKLRDSADDLSYYYTMDWKEWMNWILIENLLEEDERYVNLIKNLYEKHKNFYITARFFLALKETGTQAFEEYYEEIRQDRRIIFRNLGTIRFRDVFNGYYLSWYRHDKVEKIKMFDEIPEAFISYVTETDYFSYKKDEKPVFDKKELHETIRRALIAIQPDTLGLKSEAKDYQKCCDAAVKFAMEVNRIHSILYEILHIIIPYYQTGTAEEYMDIIANYEIQSLFDGNKFNTWALNEIDKFPMSMKEKETGLLELKEKVIKIDAVQKNKMILIDAIEKKLKGIKEN